MGLVARVTNHVIRGLELAVLPHPHPHPLPVRGEELEVDLITNTNDLIKYAYVMKPP